MARERTFHPKPGAAVTIAATTTSTTARIMADNIPGVPSVGPVIVTNNGPSVARVNYGSSTVVATLTDFAMMPGERLAMDPGVGGFAAVITASGTASVEFHEGGGEYYGAINAATASGGAGGTTTTRQAAGTGAAPSGSRTISAVNAYQSLFTAGEIINGAVIQNPNTNFDPLTYDLTGATGTTRATTSIDLQPGMSFQVPPLTTAVTVAAFGPNALTFNAVKF